VPGTAQMVETKEKAAEFGMAFNLSPTFLASVPFDFGEFMAERLP
jgi:hypothetical protein